MKPVTYFNAYKTTIERLSYYAAQRGGDYSARIRKAQRQSIAFESKVFAILFMAKNESIVVNKRYCTRCNNELKNELVDGSPVMVCLKCSTIEIGYLATEREIVHDLQNYLFDERWMIEPILQIFRVHLSKNERR